MKSCPYCGAPIENKRDTICQYCGSPLVDEEPAAPQEANYAPKSSYNPQNPPPVYPMAGGIPGIPPMGSQSQTSKKANTSLILSIISIIFSSMIIISIIALCTAQSVINDPQSSDKDILTGKKARSISLIAMVIGIIWAVLRFVHLFSA